MSPVRIRPGSPPQADQKGHRPGCEAKANVRPDVLPPRFECASSSIKLPVRLSQQQISSSGERIGTASGHRSRYSRAIGRTAEIAKRDAWRPTGWARLLADEDFHRGSNNGRSGWGSRHSGKDRTVIATSAGTAA